MTGVAARPSYQGILARLAQLLVQFTISAIVLFASAGTLAWPGAWTFVCLSLLLIVANGLYVLPRNPEVIVERGRRHTGTRRSDTAVMLGYTACYLAVFVVAGLDRRYGWAPLALGWVLSGAVLLCLADVPVAAAMAVNRNLERTVRIQSERGHDVASTGPYRMVRHPMYLAMLIQLPATALLLGSAWALIPAAGAAVALVVRTVLEDRTLLHDLPGYTGYAARTTYRLVPGIW